jgi:hypothetical protein
MTVRHLFSRVELMSYLKIKMHLQDEKSQLDVTILQSTIQQSMLRKENF